MSCRLTPAIGHALCFLKPIRKLQLRFASILHAYALQGEGLGLPSSYQRGVHAARDLRLPYWQPCPPSTWPLWPYLPPLPPCGLNPKSNTPDAQG